MTHWRKLTPRNTDYVAAEDLNGKDCTVTISDVKPGNIKGEGGRSARKALVFFQGKEKPLVANATNCKTIASMYGNDVEAWKGRRITLYPTNVQMGGETVEAIRVRPQIPPEKKATKNGNTEDLAVEANTEQEPGANG